jgi:hypothetical protein
MKKVFFLPMLATLLLLAFTACNDDDSLPQDKIVGKWKKTKVVENGVEKEPNCTYEGILEYKSDGTYISERYSDTNPDVTITDCSLFSTTSGEWVSNGNNSYTSITDGVASDVEFVFEGNNTFVFTFESNGFVAILTYKRQ